MVLVAGSATARRLICSKRTRRQPNVRSSPVPSSGLAWNRTKAGLDDASGRPESVRLVLTVHIRAATDDVARSPMFVRAKFQRVSLSERPAGRQPGAPHRAVARNRCAPPSAKCRRGVCPSSEDQKTCRHEQPFAHLCSFRLRTSGQPSFVSPGPEHLRGPAGTSRRNAPAFSPRTS